MKQPRDRSAFTLVELLVATTLSLLVVSMVLTILVRNSGVWRDGLARAHISEQSRLARERILHGINGKFGLRNAMRSQLVCGTDEILFQDAGASNAIILVLRRDQPPAWLDESGSNLVVRGGVLVEDVALSMEMNMLNIDLVLAFLSNGKAYYQPQQIRVYLLNE